MGKSVSEKGSGTFLSFIFSNVFLLLIIISTYYMHISGIDIRNIPLFDLSIVVLASYRVTRLLVYDKIFQYGRDIFLEVSEVKDEKTGRIYVHREKPDSGVRRLFADLLGCPWCASVWVSFILLSVYFILPESYYFLLVMAVAGLAVMVQQFANLIGWNCQYRKCKTEAFERSQ